MNRVSRFLAQRLFPAGTSLALLLTWPATAEAQQGMPPTPVRVAPVVEREVGRSVDMVGSVIPFKESAVASRVQGWVTHVAVNEGDEVADGDVLALLDAETLESVLAAREADLLQAETEYNRAKGLFDKAAISDLEFLTYKTEYEVAKANRDQAAKSVRDTRIVAPFSGVITRLHIEQGEWVNPGAGIVDLLDLSKVHVVGTVTPEEIASLKTGTRAELTVDAYGPRPFEGTVDRIIPSSEDGTRGFPIFVLISNQDRSLMAGMLARVEIETVSPRPMLMVPKDAVVFRGGKSVVFRMNAPQADEELPQVEELPIDVTLTDGLFVAVEGDLEPGQVVVVVGNENLTNGMNVMPAGS